MQHFQPAATGEKIMVWLERQAIKPEYFSVEKGSYLLVLQLTHAKSVYLSRFGWVKLSSGIYGYPGNARGPGGLRARLKHHLSVPHRPHWHIDWLRFHLDWIGIYYRISSRSWECCWLKALIEKCDGRIPVPGFGASDCKEGCPAHLVYSPIPATTAQWVAALDQTAEGNQEIE